MIAYASCMRAQGCWRCVRYFAHFSQNNQQSDSSAKSDPSQEQATSRALSWPQSLSGCDLAEAVLWGPAQSTWQAVLAGRPVGPSPVKRDLAGRPGGGDLAGRPVGPSPVKRPRAASQTTSRGRCHCIVPRHAGTRMSQTLQPLPCRGRKQMGLLPLAAAASCA